VHWSVWYVVVAGYLANIWKLDDLIVLVHCPESPKLPTLSFKSMLQCYISVCRLAVLKAVHATHIFTTFMYSISLWRSVNFTLFLEQRSATSLPLPLAVIHVNSLSSIQLQIRNSMLLFRAITKSANVYYNPNHF